LFLEGKSISLHPLRAIYLVTPSNHLLQAGFTVSGKKFKKAVDRNRLKRLLRETYRLQKNDLETLLKYKGVKLIVFFIYTGKEIAEYEVVNKQMNAILTALQKQLMASHE
jgi:ribonuclease P protein component